MSAVIDIVKDIAEHRATSINGSLDVNRPGLLNVAVLKPRIARRSAFWLCSSQKKPPA